MTISIIKIVLNAIKKYCAKKDDKCDKCPFSMKGAWFDYCMFMGTVPHEGRTPSEWELDEINFKDN